MTKHYLSEPTERLLAPYGAQIFLEVFNFLILQPMTAESIAVSQLKYFNTFLGVQKFAIIFFKISYRICWPQLVDFNQIWSKFICCRHTVVLQKQCSNFYANNLMHMIFCNPLKFQKKEKESRKLKIQFSVILSACFFFKIAHILTHTAAIILIIADAPIS